MKSRITALLLSTMLGVVFVGAVHANPELAKAKNCIACHTVEKPLVGPGYKEIAAKYSANKDAETYLAKKIREGGTGVWFKDRVMPPMTNVSAEEAKVLVKWILSQK